MAEDRIDDAIDAVVRAVDRIERATRGVDHAGDDAAEEAEVSTAFGAKPAVAYGDPYTHGAGFRHAPTYGPGSTPPPGPLPGTAFRPGPAAQGAEAHLQAAAPEVHELVGRIVARTQALEEHLDAARALRVEISELVSKLASAATRPR